MINLLSPEQKEELLQEEKLKLILILGIITLALLISVTLILFSVKTALLGELEVQKIYFEEREKELKTTKIQELEEEIKKLNSTLSKLDSFYRDETNLTEILEKISATFPKGIHLTLLNFNSNFSQISLIGFSPDREKLLTLKGNLEKEKKFKEVYFPPLNWVTPTDINFNITFKLQQTE